MSKQRFRVIWEADINAESPLEAAQKAYEHLMDPERYLGFDVVPWDGDEPPNHIDMEHGQVDLDEAWEILPADERDAAA